MWVMDIMAQFKSLVWIRATCSISHHLYRGLALEKISSMAETDPASTTQ